MENKLKTSIIFLIVIFSLVFFLNKSEHRIFPLTAQLSGSVPWPNSQSSTFSGSTGAFSNPNKNSEGQQPTNFFNAFESFMKRFSASGRPGGLSPQSCQLAKSAATVLDTSLSNFFNKGTFTNFDDLKNKLKALLDDLNNSSLSPDAKINSSCTTNIINCVQKKCQNGALPLSKCLKEAKNKDNGCRGIKNLLNNICAPNDFTNKKCSIAPECNNAIDDDSDNKIDFPRDKGCTSLSDDDETDPIIPSKQCADGKDNDNDGFIDLGDGGCDDADDDSEAGESQCRDHRDNDNDGLVDLQDLGCKDRDDNDEANPQCIDGADNDNDGKTDYPADYGCENPNDNTESPNPQCSDGINNDSGYDGMDNGDRACLDFSSAPANQLYELKSDGTRIPDSRGDYNPRGETENNAILGHHFSRENPRYCLTGSDDRKFKLAIASLDAPTDLKEIVLKVFISKTSKPIKENPLFATYKLIDEQGVVLGSTRGILDQEDNYSYTVKLRFPINLNIARYDYQHSNPIFTQLTLGVDIPNLSTSGDIRGVTIMPSVYSYVTNNPKTEVYVFRGISYNIIAPQSASCLIVGGEMETKLLSVNHDGVRKENDYISYLYARVLSKDSTLDYLFLNSVSLRLQGTALDWSKQYSIKLHNRSDDEVIGTCQTPPKPRVIPETGPVCYSSTQNLHFPVGSAREFSITVDSREFLSTSAIGAQSNFLEIKLTQATFSDGFTNFIPAKVPPDANTSIIQYVNE